MNQNDGGADCHAAKPLFFHFVRWYDWVLACRGIRHAMHVARPQVRLSVTGHWVW
jgi:hypothetical protein